ncbi:DUF2867 domain-containing protein [Methylorubrum extorquens]|uniref:DUF2867 domain-containing protein n=1 Tax=Methylorubrum extorquens TaxID=408 RepID=UPI001649F1EE|nr:DUF2867 domain-containing protein [Methylorubrum extorquens]
MTTTIPPLPPTEPAFGRRGDRVAATIVRCHNLLGRAYLAAITPGHVLVVRSTLVEAGRH